MIDSYTFGRLKQTAKIPEAVRLCCCELAEAEFSREKQKMDSGGKTSEKIGTYETSIQPYEDCCTIFVAKHPVTKPNIKVIHKSEENLAEKIDELVKTALETVEVIKCW